jgi:4-diphosphocytidyl-2C-methyl-D-erythritol kinase
LGAEFAGLSGAGSTCFGVFSQQATAEKAAEALSKTWKFVRCTVIYTGLEEEKI